MSPHDTMTAPRHRRGLFRHHRVDPHAPPQPETRRLAEAWRDLNVPEEGLFIVLAARRAVDGDVGIGIL